jgi:hypothetical protein
VNPQADPNAFMRQVVAHEVRARELDKSLWAYRLRKEDTKGSYTREIVQTRDGAIARALIWNNQPLTPEQRRKDDERLEKLVRSSEEQRKKRQETEQDRERALRMLKALPDGFRFYFLRQVGDMVTLRFDPNPEYDPPTRELQIYHHMVGTVEIDSRAMRMTRIQATLRDDVSFGWGIIGKLYQGGTVELTQSMVGGNHWDITHMNLNFRGRAALFKNIVINTRQWLTSFRRVPDNLSMADGAKFLRNQPDILAEK